MIKTAPFSAIAACAVLAGCAMNPVSPGLAQKEGVVITSGANGHQYFEGFTVTRPSVATEKDLTATCLLTSLNNEQVTLQSSVGSFVGAYTGNYYETSQSREAGGGQVIQYLSDDGGKAVAQGMVRSTGVLGVDYAIRFSLNAALGANESKYSVTGVRFAQLDTGLTANDGFNPMGAWGGASPEPAYDAISAAVTKLHECLSVNG
ncbi:hypothetical protein [Oceanimonas smirnovii]|uniref:hypothetical protein n=1 Tax=Oceanimonas smirnovii TaxID=264574 RepID=UPI003FCFC1C2